MTIDQMLEVTGHGKDEADGHGGVFKNWLLKPAAMNSKRRAASNLKDRHFRTYTEADVGDAPAIKPLTHDLRPLRRVRPPQRLEAGRALAG